MKITMLHDISVLVEEKDGFDKIDIAGTTFEMREREGATYNSFSHRCKVLHDPKGTKEPYEVLVHHFVADQRTFLEDEEVMLAYKDQILGIKVRSDHDVQSDDYFRNFDGIGGELAETHEIVNESNLLHNANKQESWEVNMAKGFGGKIIQYVINGDYEFWHREKVYFYIKDEDIFLKGDEIGEKFVELTKIGEVYYDGDNAIYFPERFLVKTKDGRMFTKKEVIQCLFV
jgi:hypothetical protein